MVTRADKVRDCRGGDGIIALLVFFAFIMIVLTAAGVSKRPAKPSPLAPPTTSPWRCDLSEKQVVCRMSID